jgi:hypothetical protein
MKSGCGRTSPVVEGNGYANRELGVAFIMRTDKNVVRFDPDT